MNLLKSIVLCASLVLGVAGCATAPPPIPSEVAARIKRVAPISVVADNFTRQYVGLTVFGNEREEKPISTWSVDSAYEQQMASAIEGLGITAIREPYPAAEFAHVNDLNGPWSAPAFWGPNWEAIGPAARAYCSAHSLDALLVVAKQTSGDFLGGTNQVISGAGIYVRGPGERVSVMHLLARVGLVDCVTGKALVIRTLSRTRATSPSAVRQALPIVAIPAEMSRVPIPEWSNPMQEAIRNNLTALPGDAWSETLGSMFPSQ